MKLVLCLALGLPSFCVGAYSANWRIDGDLHELVAQADDVVQAYESANAFSTEVGRVLRENYDHGKPSKALDPDVSLRVFFRDGQKIFRLVWSCRIVPAFPANADYHFDRRGLLLSGGKFDALKESVPMKLHASWQVQKMRQAWRRSSIPSNFIRDTWAGSSAEGYWYLEECFLVAPK